MKILIVNTFYSPNMIGGAEHSVKLLAEGLCKRGHSVAVFSIDGSSTIKETINGIDVYRSGKTHFDYNARFFGKGNIMNKLFSRILDLYNYELKEDYEWAIQDFEPDIIHTNNIYGLSPFVWIYASNKSIPIVHTVRDYFLLRPNSLYEKRDLLSIFACKIYMSYFRKFSQIVNAVTAPSSFILNKYIESNYFKSSQKYSIWNAVSFNIDDVKNAVNKKLSRREHKTIFLYAGSLIEIKGVRNLLSAVNDLKDIEYELHICGDGPLHELVEDACHTNKNILYFGNLSEEELYQQYQICDVVVVPSIWEEPFGRTLIEANMCGCPIVGSNQGGISEIVGHTKTGILYQYNDWQQLAVAMRFMSLRENRTKFIYRIPEAIKDFDITIQVEKFEKLYILLLNSIKI